MDKPQYGPGYVYLLHAKGTDLYKIGLSRDPEKRVNHLNYESPYEIILIRKILVDRMFPVEEYFHRIFHHRNVKNEWFRLSNFEVEMFHKIKNHTLDEIVGEIVMEHKYYEYLMAQRRNG